MFKYIAFQLKKCEKFLTKKLKDYPSSDIIVLLQTNHKRKDNLTMILTQNFKNLNTKAIFSSNNISSNVNFTFIEYFKNKIGFKSLLEKFVSYTKYHNAKYTPSLILDFIIDSSILGFSRFSHMDDLRNDFAYQEIKGIPIPSETTCRTLLTALPESTCEELRALNMELLNLKALNEEPREIMIDFDDTVCTVFGSQEGSVVGYNPRYKGRPSFKEKIGMISGTNELLNVTLEEGNHHSNHNFLDFLKNIIASLPKNWVLKRIRLDKGFFDEKLFNFCEENCIEYNVKAKMYNSIKSAVSYVENLPQYYTWDEINSIYSVTEIVMPLPKWEKARRFVIIRKRIKNPSTQLSLYDDEFQYNYQAVITNIDDLSPRDIFSDYNKRCNVENKIDDLKTGFHFDQNSLLNKKANELFLLLKMIAYNLQNWFKTSIMPEEFKQSEINTLRRVFFKVPGNLAGVGRYRHIKFSINKRLEKIISHVNNRLNQFAPQLQ